MRRTILPVLALLFLAGCGGAGKAAGGAWAAESSQRGAANASLNAELDPATHLAGGYSYCVGQVRDRLKAPATAVFSSMAASTPVANGSHMTFTGTVDSQNSYGALLRSTWDCDIRWLGASRYVGDAVIHDGGAS